MRPAGGVRTDLLDYQLPEELIAQRPPAERDAGRLLVVGEAGIEHCAVRALPDLLSPLDLLVVNETRVRRARLDCRRPRDDQGGGGRVELLFLQPSSEWGGVSPEPDDPDDLSREVWLALGRGNRPLRPGDRLESTAGELEVGGRREQGIIEVLVPARFEELLARHGQVPIPPYMRREADVEDMDRYQTVFAKHLGSAAAPTAGLHLTEDMLERARQRGTSVAALTLHVGIGTFRPVKVDDLDDHPMHSEWISVDSSLCDAIAAARKRGGRVVAIGTTVVRALESAGDPERLGYVRSFSGETNLLIQPGYSFRVTDCLLTNFHQPRSTLLALVAAFGGYRRVMDAYKEAVEQRYRFLSYGDAMWLERPLGES